VSDADLIKEARWLAENLDNDLLGNVLADLADALERAENRLYWRDGNQGVTHYEGCWRDHYGCAMAKIERLQAENFALAAGACGFRGGDERGHPICLATGKHIETIKGAGPLSPCEGPEATKKP